MVAAPNIDTAAGRTETSDHAADRASLSALTCRGQRAFRRSGSDIEQVDRVTMERRSIAKSQLKRQDIPENPRRGCPRCVPRPADSGTARKPGVCGLSLIHISEPTRLGMSS